MRLHQIAVDLKGREQNDEKGESKTDLPFNVVNNSLRSRKEI